MTKRFGAQTVLDGVSLQVPTGSWASLEGQNGAGKTTLLRICATIQLPDSGHARILGADTVTEAAFVRRHTGMALVNERSLVWRLDAIANLRLWATARGLAGRAGRLAIHSVLEELGLGTHTGKMVSQLSSGQRHRLVLARALLADPAVLLIDEPLRGLDQPSIELVLTALQSRVERGATVLTAAPRLDELANASSQSFELSDGRISPSIGSAQA